MTKRILIIEDQEDNRAIMRDLLTGAGFELIEAVDGEEGVKLAQSERPPCASPDRRRAVAVPLPSESRYLAMAGVSRARNGQAPASSFAFSCSWLSTIDFRACIRASGAISFPSPCPTRLNSIDTRAFEPSPTGSTVTVPSALTGPTTPRNELLRGGSCSVIS